MTDTFITMREYEANRMDLYEAENLLQLFVFGEAIYG